MTGFCECGCGQRTTLITKNHTAQGRVKGEHSRFVHGHGTRGMRAYPKGEKHPMWKGGRTVHGSGYIHILCRGHPRAQKHSGYVLEHIVVAERALGRFIPRSVQVHHHNGDRGDNRPANLVICQDNAYHCLIERRTKAFRACGNPDWKKCRFCQQYDDPASMYVTEKNSYHNRCSNERQIQRRQRVKHGLEIAGSLEL